MTTHKPPQACPLCNEPLEIGPPPEPLLVYDVGAEALPPYEPDRPTAYAEARDAAAIAKTECYKGMIDEHKLMFGDLTTAFKAGADWGYERGRLEADHWHKKYGQYVDKWCDKNAECEKLRAERPSETAILANIKGKRCCQNGLFGDEHDCAKQPNETDEVGEYLKQWSESLRPERPSETAEQARDRLADDYARHSNGMINPVKWYAFVEGFDAGRTDRDAELHLGYVDKDLFESVCEDRDLLDDANIRLNKKVARLEQELTAARVRIEQHRGALGYSVSGDIPADPNIVCGLCEAKAKQLDQARAEVERLSKIHREMWGPAGSKHVGDIILERDKYRAALERIADNPEVSSNPDIPTNPYNWVRWAKNLAREALGLIMRGEQT